MISKTWRTVATVGVLATTLAACGGGNDDSTDATSTPASTSSEPLTFLTTSQGNIELKLLKDAAKTWATKNNKPTPEVAIAGDDLQQRLAQGFTSGNPADVFLLGPDVLPGYASKGSLLAYGDKLKNKADFYPNQVQTYTYDGKFYCAPKDSATLALFINTDYWKAAGLTDADIPTTWDELTEISKKLTKGKQQGMVFGNDYYQRIGAFMAQAGGNLTDPANTKATADSPENKTALEYVKKNLADGTFKYAKAVDAGWGGEAFGKGITAMTIEGNWLIGALKAEFPSIKYTVAELPAGPKGKGTMQFSNCWGIAADSKNQTDAISFVEHLTSTDQQLTFGKELSLLPSVQSAAGTFAQQNPTFAPFIAGAEYSIGVPVFDGANEVITDFNSKLEALAKGDTSAILKEAQDNLSAGLGQ
ncbi:MAG: sugar ABC transporter substrate-binding protein [Actinomycetota bacterium]